MTNKSAPVLHKERPILFSGPMVRAILGGWKTQTRRVMKPQPSFVEDTCWYPGVPINMYGKRERALCYASEKHFRKGVSRDFYPYGRPGDRLWVREAWRVRGGDEYEYQQHQPSVIYRADTEAVGDWKSSIHMPRWASRITLEVTGVRVERVQEISEEDAIVEGVDAVSMAAVPRQGTLSRRDDFRQLWDKINAARGFGWNVNPWVWVLEFKRAEKDRD